MSADVESRKLHSLRVTDLRNELGKRNLDSKGVKNELVDRLAKALESEGHNVEEYIFDIDSSDKKTPRASKRRTLGEGDFDKEDVTTNDSSSTVEDERKDSKDGDVIEDTEAVEDEDDSVEEDTNKNESVLSIDASSAEITESVKLEPEPEETSEEKPVEEAPEVEVKQESLEETTDKNDAPKEQRVNTSKKSVTEESKEKPEDTEDSINLTIGEDEVKLFGEEEESTHDKDGKENHSETSNTDENVKTNPKNGEEDKQDAKANVKKTPTKVSGSSRNLWVSGLSSMTRATDLKTLFSKYGKVVAAKIVTNAKTPGSRCYGYVTMLSADDATISMQNLHKTELNGRMILVERAKDDGTGPARPKVVKKESEKKKVSDTKDEKKPAEEKKKTSVKIEDEVKQEDKKTKDEESKEGINGETKTGSVKSEKIRSSRSHSQRSSKSKERLSHKLRDSNGKPPRPGVLTFAQIKEERERHRMRERERALRIEEKRRQIERERQRETERKQREEANRLERERMRLKMEREKIEREKAELLKMEREAQRQERERLIREKEELRRAQMKLEESRRAVKRPLEITRTFEDDRKRRPPSPDRRHVHVSSSSTNRKEPISRSNGNRRGSPSEYVSSRRAYDSTIESSRKELSSHSSRDKSGKDGSRYDHHNYQSSHGNDDVRSKDVRHRYPDPPSKSGSKVTQSSRYDRSVDSWARPSSSNVSSSVKQFSNMSSAGGSSSMSSRETWGGDRKSDAPPPWSRNTSTSDRWAGSSTSTSSMPLGRSGPMSGSNTMYSSSGGNYSDNMQNMSMMALTSGAPSYSDRFDAYKSGMRKY